MPSPLHVLMLEDSPLDADLIALRLQKGGLECELQRVETRDAFINALHSFRPDLILGDHSLPTFDGLTGLQITLEICPAVPFIFVSGVMGEEVAVEMLQRGATDYVLKSRLDRLEPAVRRALRVIEERAARRAAETALREAETRYRRLVEEIHDYAIITLDPSGRVMTWNSGARQIFGYDEADVAGRAFEVFFRPAPPPTPAESEPAPPQAAAPAPQAAAPVPEAAVPAPHAAPAPHAPAPHAPAPHAPILPLAGAARIPAAPGPTIVPTPVPTPSTPPFLPPHTAFSLPSPAALLDAARRDGSRPTELWLLDAARVRFFASGSVSVFKDPAGIVLGLTVILRDATGRRTLDEERIRLLASEQQSRREAESANRAKDAFLAVLSHELRTPLSPVLTTANLLERDETLSPQQHTHVETIRRNVELEARLIDDLLDVTRISRGKMQLQRETINAHRVIRDALETCASELSEKRLKLHLELHAGQTHLDADAARLQQVLWNLLKNAIKFTPGRGSITVTTENHLPGQLLICVRDTGIGISEEALPRIFNAFEQADAGTVRRFGGLGLGLAIAKALAEAHGGTLAAESDGEGTGATFLLTLPTSTSAIVNRTDPDKEPQHALDILLVEDHADTARMMTLLLRSLGHRPRLAGSVREASDLLAVDPAPDLLISDLGLPDGSGLEIARVKPAALPALALTGFGMDGDVARCREAGFAAHLTKPINVQKLRSAISSLVVSPGPRV